MEVLAVLVVVEVMVLLEMTDGWKDLSRRLGVRDGGVCGWE